METKGDFAMAKKIKVWKKNNIIRQCCVVLLIVFAGLVVVFFADVLSNPGRSWSESLVIKMIFDRRSQD